VSRALAIAAAATLLLTACDRAPAPAPAPTLTPATTPASATPSPTATPASTPPAVRGVPAPAAWEPDALAPVEMSAPGQDIVWALLTSIDGPALFRSTNRGDTWESRGLPPGIARGQVSFLGDREGWLGASGPASVRCPEATLVLWRTTDAGDTWTQVTTRDAGGALCAGTVSFVSPTTGFLGGARSNGGVTLYRTDDGGGTWRAAAALPGIDAAGGALSLGTVRAFGSTLLLVTNPFAAPQSQGRRIVYRSTDGGATWSRLAETGASLGLASASRWIVLDAPGESRESTDAGATWHPFVTDYSQASPIPPVVHFAGANVGYATTRSTIQRTIDGGVHWTRIPTPDR